MELAYRVDGPPGGPALLLVNSIGTDLRMWEPQVVAFSDRYRVVRYDYPGHGDSRRPSGAQTVAGLAGHALSLLDQLQIERTHVCGISLGGMVAMELAARHANLGVTSGRQAIEEAAELLETRGIIVLEHGRFRVRDRSVLRYYARTIEHLLVTTGRTH